MPILCLLAALGIFSTSLYLPSLPAIGEALSTSEETIQLTLTVFFLGSALGHLFLGPLSDRNGRLIVAKGGLILFIAASFWCANADNIVSLLIGRFLQGIAASSGQLIARAVGRDLYEGTHFARFTATIMMVISISPAIAPSLGGLIESYFGWEKNFYFLMTFGLVIASMVWRWLPETNKHQDPSLRFYAIFKNYGILLKNSSYGLLCLIIHLQLAALFYYVTMSPYIFISFFGWSPQLYGYVCIATALGNIIGFSYARHRAHHVPFHRGILVGSFFCGFLSFALVGSIFMFPITPTLLVFYVICFFSMQALVVVNASAAAMSFFPHMAGTSSAMLGAVQISAGILGSLLASLLPISPSVLGLTMGSLSFASFILGIYLQHKNYLYSFRNRASD